MAKKNTRKKDVHHKIEVETNEKDSNFWDEKQNIEKEEVTMKEVVPTETTLSEKKKRKIKVSLKQQVAYFFLALSFVTTVCYFIYTVLTSSDLVNQMSTIIATGLLTFFSLFFIFTGLFADNKKGQSFLIISSFLLTCFSGFQLGCEIGFIKVPTQKYVENFTNKNLTEVVAWASENNITLEQNYEYSDAIEPYHVISQNVDPGTLVKKVDTLQVTISDGPNYDKDFILPSMLGWNVDDVLTFIDENFLSNVTIDFEFSDSARDTIINQDVSGQMKRNAAIHFIASLGSEEELLPTDMKNLVGLSSFQATTWLKRNGLKFELLYEYSDTVRKGNVLNQSVSEGTTVDPKDASLVITLTISKGPKISVPNLLSMSVDEITAWVVENNASVAQILNVIRDVQPEKFVLAHMGGWACWEDVERDLAGAPVWLDTAFTIGPITPHHEAAPGPYSRITMADEDFLRLARKHGTDRILFATDSPWQEQPRYVKRFKELGLNDEEYEKIMSQNALHLLGKKLQPRV